MIADCGKQWKSYVINIFKVSTCELLTSCKLHCVNYGILTQVQFHNLPDCRELLQEAPYMAEPHDNH